MRRFLVIAAVLASFVPATWVLQQFMVTGIESETSNRQRALSARFVHQIGDDFDHLRSEMRQRALAVAADDDAAFLLDRAMESEPPDLQTVAAVRRFRARHEAGPASSTELFDSQGNLVVWSGFSFLPPPATWPPDLDGWVTVTSDAYRKCLVMWYPVGPRGVVRVAQVVQLTESNVESIRTEDLGLRWSHLTGSTVDVLLDDSTTAAPPTDEEFVTVSLRNGAGVKLGQARISIPSSSSLIREGKRHFGDLQAVWFGLLMGWVFAGLWVALRRWWLSGPIALSRMTAAAAGRVVLLIGLRFGFLLIKLPSRWFRSSEVAAVFDPMNLASSVAGGVARSTGDLLITGIFSVVAAVAVMTVVRRYLAVAQPVADRRARLLTMFAVSSAVTGCITWQALLTRRAMLDATLDFFAWTGLAPEPLVLVVFCALLLSTIAAVLIAGTLTALTIGEFRRREQDAGPLWAAVGVSLVTPVLAFAVLKLSRLIPVWLFAGYVVAVVVTGILIRRGRIGSVRSLRLRPIVAVILVAATLLYPLVYLGMDAHRRLRVIDVAEEFVERSDDQAVANASALLNQMASSEQLSDLLHASGPSIPRDSWIRFARSLPAAEIVPGIVSVRVLLFDANGFQLGGYDQKGSGAISLIPAGFGVGRLSRADTTDAPRVDVLRDDRSGESVGYAGIASVQGPDGEIAGWLTARFQRHGVSTPFGSLFGYSDWRRSLSLAEFKGGIRVRSEGENFERYTIPTDVVEDLNQRPEVWQDESIYGRSYLTYYLRLDSGPENDASAGVGTVVAVRARAVIPYDHLYYLLRMALAGLWFGLPIFLVGLALRRRRGELPAKRTQIGDRVLDAFMLVGTLAVLVMGLVGQQVITRENEGAIRSRLQRRLERVEGALQRAAGPDEPLFAVQRRLPIDSLARELSLDLNVYNGPWLSEYSQMGGDVLPLMGYRLPPSAYDDLFLKRFRQSFVESTGQYGFVYTIGYKALMDEDGNPVSVVAVLTAPEQERIREERARTTAYFFGALLILLLVIMGTATVLASALAGPITRLRDGLRSVAEGRFQRPIPVDSRDEVGELVETFNLMQSQLAESRRRLAQQERELAWREMARQVAHEIKNPLTPMKLSIQHLQRAFEEGDETRNQDFAAVFRRITKTVSEQIETLANIANEFSTFARMPKRHLEHLDVDEIVREAIALLQEEGSSEVVFTSSIESAVVEADRDELRRVFINLIKNAQQATDAEGTVTVHTRADLGIGDRVAQPVVVAEIVDTGSGILEEVRDKIFQPNFSTKTSGMGLGLAIAKKSIEDVRGEIGFTTEDGKGSTFWVRLPVVG
ncbi:MAG: ATP-binding protein [Rhodothermales bacterium]